MNITSIKLTKIINHATDKAAKNAVKVYRPIWKKDMKGFINETKRHNRALLGSFKESLKGMTEIAKAKPNEGRVKEIIKEETKDTRTQVALTVKAVSEINKKLKLTNA